MFVNIITWLVLLIIKYYNLFYTYGDKDLLQLEYALILSAKDYSLQL